jgi:hypothetical protein
VFVARNIVDHEIGMRTGRPLTLIGLLSIIAFIWCGGCIGFWIAELIGLLRGRAINGVYGKLIGSLAAFLLLVLWGWWFGKMDRIHPPCKCGKSGWEDFDLGSAEGFRNVRQCSCGKKYSWPKWQLWFEISDHNTAQLYMTRNYFRSWRLATEREMARHSPEITRPRQKRPV